MAIKNIIAKGIGFASDGTIWIPTHGFSIGAAVAAVSGVFVATDWLESHTIFSQWDQPHTVFHEQPGRVEHPGIDSVVIIAAPVVPDFFWEWPN